MKICMVIWKYHPCLEGGAERQCRKIVNELMQRGHQCTVLSAFVDKKMKVDGSGKSGERILRLGGLSWLNDFGIGLAESITAILGLSFKYQKIYGFWLAFPFVWLARLSFMRSLKNYLATEEAKVDVIHVHEAHWIAGAVAWAAKGAVPVVCKEADYPFKASISYDTPFRRRVMSSRMKMHFIAITEAIKRSMLEVGVEDDRISLIPNGVEIGQNVSPIVGSTSIIYIGNFTQGTHRKAFDILFEAWVDVHRRCPELILTALGGGDTAYWHQYLEDNDCKDSVVFGGSVSDVTVYLKQARLFLLPSRVEGLSNALLEAMSWGVPVIVSDIPTHRNLVIHNKNGIVVPVNDSNALADQVIKLYKNDELSVKLAGEGRSMILSGYSIQMVANSLEELYGHLVDTR